MIQYCIHHQIVVYKIDPYVFTFYHTSSFYDESQLRAATLATPYFGSYTNTSGGLWRMLSDQFMPQSGDRANVPNVCIVLTDGQSNVDEHILETHIHQAEVNLHAR